MMNTGAGKDEETNEQPLHCGKWTPEEEAYVQCLIEEFQAGYLPIREGTSLRSFLSKMLNCKPKRISKKFEGSDYNGKQVYASQPYKLTTEEARERRDRLCKLEKKFHQSVAELKNVEGMKQQQHQNQPLSSMANSTGLGLGLTGLDGSTTGAMGGMGSPSFTSVGALGGVGSSAAGGGTTAGSAGGMSSMSNDMNNSMSMGMGGMGMQGGGGSGNNQYLEELAFQESMLRLRQQQNQLHQMNGVAGLGGNSSVNTGSGSYVDPILGNMGLSQSGMNTTPMAASQYWRNQALLDASSHMDNLRMAQAGAIGIQRPALDPGNIRDLRVPNSLMGGAGANSNANEGGNLPDDMAQYQQQQLGGNIGGKDVGTVGLQKKRGLADTSTMSDMMKRVRRMNDPDGQRHANLY